jgi:hypothetical protein
MSIQIPKPSITAADDRQRLQQIQSYLYRMAGQLQWAFDTLETGSGTSLPLVQKESQWENPASTFSGIKNLIIKSADIVNAYYDQISHRLEGLYVAQSEFGTYTQETQQEIRANSEGIRQLFTQTQTLSQSVDQMYDSILETNAYLKTGKLQEDENGISIYGLEIGQTKQQSGVTVFDKFARFTADRLSFFDSNDVEVAYISDYHLHITNAVITGSLVLMQQFQVSLGNQSVDFKWLGG